MAGTINPSLKLLGLFAALALAVGLAACGSSDSTTSASTTADTTAQETETEATGKGGSKAGGKSEAGDKSKSGAEKGSGDGHRSSEEKKVKFTPPPLKVSGGGSKQFEKKGGDNSVQEYGDEGGESELQEVAGTVYDFYVARGHGDWDKACSYLAKSMVKQFEELAARTPQLKGKGCAPVLEAFTRALPASVEREITTVDAGSFRHEGEQGFLIYYGAPHRTVYAMPMREEDGEWKVGAISGDALP